MFIQFFWNVYSALDYVWNVCYKRRRPPSVERAHAKPNGAAGAEGGNRHETPAHCGRCATVLSSPAFASMNEREHRRCGEANFIACGT